MMGYRIFACDHAPTGWEHCPVCGSTDLVEKCTCGSGCHPRRCDTHPDAFVRHVARLQAEEDSEPDE